MPVGINFDWLKTRSLMLLALFFAISYLKTLVLLHVHVHVEVTHTFVHVEVMPFCRK